ncbi:cytochrome P450, partial [Streptomyces sp. NPDC059701]
MTDSGYPSARPAPPGCPAHAGAVRLGGLEYQQTPAQLYRALRREHGPVAPVLLDGDIPAWLVLGYSEVTYVTSHDELFARDSRRWNQWDSIPPDWPLLPFVGYQPWGGVGPGGGAPPGARVVTQGAGGGGHGQA